MIKKSSTHEIALSIAASILAACGAQAYDLNLGTNMPPVTFHGFASQGFLASDQYNYLGDTTRGSFLFTEAGLNAAVNPFPRTRITAQAFTYDIGEVGKYDVVLDYASIEYTFNDEFGIRAGRIRRPQGIYNAIQDVDLARTFVLLPQGMYDIRFRDFYVSTDGGEFFGTIPLSKAGSLSYEGYLGVSDPSMDGGVPPFLRSMMPSFVQLDSIGSFMDSGAQVWWDTPVDGLRIGGATRFASDFSFTTTAFGMTQKTEEDALAYQFSAQYLWKSWTFQAEYYNLTFYPYTTPSLCQETWYASAAYRFNKWLEAGAYYTESYGNVDQTSNPQLYQKDAALSLRFDPTDWWIFKIEGHCIHGTGLLEDNNSNPPSKQDDRLWFMLAIKTTFSF